LHGGCSRRISTVTVVVLAAGRSSRFGSDKLLYDIGGDTLIERALRACGTYAVVVVAAPAIAQRVSAAGKTIVVNDEPERGMTHSLKLANARIAGDHAVVVLPADLLHVTRDDVAWIVEQSVGFDVTFPARADGTPGHPVVFSSAARAYIDELPDGDTIRQLRDRRGLRRRVVVVEDDWPFRDIDIRSDFSS
jgi:molybdenum cofactor cytidylyltransferase